MIGVRPEFCIATASKDRLPTYAKFISPADVGALDLEFEVVPGPRKQIKVACGCIGRASARRDRKFVVDQPDTDALRRAVIHPNRIPVSFGVDLETTSDDEGVVRGKRRGQKVASPVSVKL